MPAFDPSSAAAAKQHAALLGASEEHLGNLLAELYAAMPSLAACGFRASFGKQLQATSALMRQASSSRRAASAAAAAPTLGVDMQALQALEPAGAAFWFVLVLFVGFHTSSHP